MTHKFDYYNQVYKFSNYSHYYHLYCFSNNVFFSSQTY